MSGPQPWLTLTGSNLDYGSWADCLHSILKSICGRNERTRTLNSTHKTISAVFSVSGRGNQL